MSPTHPSINTLCTIPHHHNTHLICKWSFYGSYVCALAFIVSNPMGKLCSPPQKKRHHNQKQRLSGATFNKGTPRSSANQRRNAGDEAVQNQWFYSKCAAAANDALIFPASPPDERRVHFIDWQRKVRVGERPPPGPPKMKWYFVWRNQNKASKRSQWGTWTQLHYRQEEEEKKKQKERSRRRESQRDQVWHSACHLAHFPLGSYFALPVEDSWRVHLQKQLSLIFPKSCFFFFF